MSITLDLSILAAGDHPARIAQGVVIMLELAGLSFLLALFVAVLMATMRMSSSRIASGLAAAYVEFHQNVPLLVHIFLWYFGVPALLPPEIQGWVNDHNGEFLAAFLAIGLCLGAYMSEDIRGGIRSIPRSQLEASRALGLSYLQASRLVILPQALRIALPPNDTP